MPLFKQVEPNDNDLDLVQAVLDYVQVQHRGRDLRIGLLGLDSDNNFCYLDGRVEYDKDEDSEYVPPVQYCGFSRNFLSKTKAPYKPRRRRSPQETAVVPVSTTISAENHAKRVSELLKEEEKSKEKTEKKRLKKLRQRENRRLAKLELEKQKTNSNINVEARASDGGAKGVSRDSDSSDSSDKDSSEDEEDSDGESVCSSAEELDMTSSFVSNAVVRAKCQLEQMSKPEKRPERKNSSPPAAPTPPPALVPASRPKEKPNTGYIEFKKNSDSPSPEDVLQISANLGVMGNKCASSGRFALAVKYFTDAIKYNPTEYRLFGNRSFCFEKMQEYERSLTDAELSLSLSPQFVKGLYRKGRALAGLQRYEEAAQAFKEVLQLDSSCADAAQELMRVQITQLMEFGFSREQSSNALIIHGTVKKALEALSKIAGIPAPKNGTTGLPNRINPPATTSLPNGTYPPATPGLPNGIYPPATPGLPNGTYPPATPGLPIGTYPPETPALPNGIDTTATAAVSNRPAKFSTKLPPRFQAQAAAFHAHSAQAPKLQKTQAQNPPKTQTQAKPTPQYQIKSTPQTQAKLTPQTQAKQTPRTQAKQTPQSKPTPKQNSPAKTKAEMYPIWVGNVALSVNDSILQDLFSSVGKILSVKILRGKRCAFINYTNQKDCDDAIQKYHGHELHDVCITVRYPDRIPDHLGISKSAHQAVDMPDDGKSNYKECFFWRNMGCSRRPACQFKHILEHKGIDICRRKTTEE